MSSDSKTAKAYREYRKSSTKFIDDSIGLNEVANSQRNFPEDYANGENQYQNKCRDCGKLFFGYKYRNFCKVCLGSMALPVPTFGNPSQEAAIDMAITLAIAQGRAEFKIEVVELLKGEFEGEVLVRIIEVINNLK